MECCDPKVTAYVEVTSFDGNIIEKETSLEGRWQLQTMQKGYDMLTNLIVAWNNMIAPPNLCLKIRTK